MADGTRYSPEEIYGFARGAGFSPDQAATMTAIALAESGGDTGAHNSRGEDSRGLWQINVKAHRHLEDVDLHDPRANAAAAFEVSRGGADISPWTVTHGSTEARYLQFREAAEAAAEAAGDGTDLGAWEGVVGYGDRTPAGDAEPTTEPTTEPDDAPGDDAALRTFLDAALAQTGDAYHFGAEVTLDDADPEEFDCSELVQWAVHQAGATIPDGAIYQYRHLVKEGTAMSVEDALETPGALLFRFSEDPSSPGTPAHAHVAISLGDGRTIEARGKDYGVGSWEANEHRFQYAGYVPAFGAEPLSEEPATPPETTPETSPEESQTTTPVGPVDEAVLGDLRDLEETYGTAANLLHAESLDQLEKEVPELADAFYERGGLMAQLRQLPDNRSFYEDRRDSHRERADELNAEVARLEQEGSFEEAEETLEEVLRADARARLEQTRVDGLDRREAALLERTEQLDQQIAAGRDREELASDEASELEQVADSLDDARRSVQAAIALRQEAARLHLEAEQATAEGDADRAEALTLGGREALQRSDVAAEQARQAVPDTDAAHRALEEAEELNDASIVLDGEAEINAAGLEGPGTSDEDLDELRAGFDRAGEALHDAALQELRAAGETQVLEQNLLNDRAHGLGAELEYVRSQLAVAAQTAEARGAKAERLREEATGLRGRGEDREAEEKLEEADRVDVLRDVVERGVERWTARERQLAEQHREAVDGAVAARKTAIEQAGRESALEQSADDVDDATRLLDEAIAVRAEAHRLGLAAQEARSSGETQRYEQLSGQAAQQMVVSEQLVQQAREMVSGNDDAREAVDREVTTDPGDVTGIRDGSDEEPPLGEPVDPFGDDPLGEPVDPFADDPLGEEGLLDPGEAVQSDLEADAAADAMSDPVHEPQAADEDFGADTELAPPELAPPELAPPEIMEPAFAEPDPVPEPVPAPAPSLDDPGQSFE